MEASCTIYCILALQICTKSSWISLLREESEKVGKAFGTGSGMVYVCFFLRFKVQIATPLKGGRMGEDQEALNNSLYSHRKCHKPSEVNPVGYNLPGWPGGLYTMCVYTAGGFIGHNEDCGGCGGGLHNSIISGRRCGHVFC